MRVPVDRHRDAVVVPGWEARRGRCRRALHDRQIARRKEKACVAIRVGDAPLAAVVDLQTAGRACALHGAGRGVHVVIHDLNARENRVDRLHHFPIGAAETIDRVLGILMQHRRQCVRESFVLFCCGHCAAPPVFS